MSFNGDLEQLRDPQRRWMRHTYQEGPRFRFLATRGGRPPGAAGPRHDLAVVRERASLVRVLRAKGLVAALDLGRCSRRSLFRWQAAYVRDGLAALVPEHHGPRTRTFTHPGWVEQVVIAVRLHTYWKRGSPNSLWHIDIKGPFFIQLGRGRYLKTYLVGLVDDHSRYLIGLRILPAATAEPILAWLAECIELCGQPLDLMSDNGNPFAVWMAGVLTRFGTTLRELAVRQIKTQVNSPWTNGKIEAVWATLKSEVLDRQVFRSIADAEAALAVFARYYNYHRLHGEIGWLTPAERYDGTPFTDRGFDHVPALAHLVPWLNELRKAA